MADRRPTSARAIRKAARRTNFRIPDEGEDDYVDLATHKCEFDIVGESHKRKQIEALLREAERQRLVYEVGSSWNLVEIRFWLVPEPSNGYDANAVTVATGPDLSKSLQVGYISREEAAQLSPRLAEPAEVLGIIIGRADRWGVKLDQPTMDGLLASGEAAAGTQAAESCKAGGEGCCSQRSGSHEP